MASRLVYVSDVFLVVLVAATNAMKATYYNVENPQNGDDHDSVGSCGTHISDTDMVGALWYVASAQPAMCTLFAAHWQFELRYLSQGVVRADVRPLITQIRRVQWR